MTKCFRLPLSFLRFFRHLNPRARLLEINTQKLILIKETEEKKCRKNEIRKKKKVHIKIKANFYMDRAGTNEDHQRYWTIQEGIENNKMRIASKTTGLAMQQVVIGKWWRYI